MTRRTLLILAPLAALLLTTRPAGAQDSDLWYEIWIAGARSGYTREIRTTEEGRVTTRTVSTISVKRADMAIEISTDASFVETERGEPVEMTLEQTFGQTIQSSRFVFEGDEVVLTGSAVPGETRRPAPAGKWLPPAAAGEYFRQRLAAGADRIVVRTLSPENGLDLVETTRTGFRESEVEVLGRTVGATRCESVSVVGPSRVPGVEYFDSEGQLLRSEARLGTLEFTQVLSTRERALLAADPAEIMVATFVRPSEPIRAPRTTRRAVFRVGLSEGELPPLPASAFQSVETGEDGRTTVTVDLDRVSTAQDADRETHLAATGYANRDDELIVQLTEQALSGAGDDPGARAEALRRFVFHHIRNKDLGTAFATASETARTCEGDCSEHGVLLAAMLRAADIPSRVAVGVVYVERFAGERNVFGYHMWTQALLGTEGGEAWIDLDATLDERRAFDATHIAFATSALADGETMSSLSGIAPLLGALQIEVVEAE